MFDMLSCDSNLKEWRWRENDQCDVCNDSNEIQNENIGLWHKYAKVGNNWGNTGFLQIRKAVFCGLYDKIQCSLIICLLYMFFCDFNKELLLWSLIQQTQEPACQFFAARKGNIFLPWQITLTPLLAQKFYFYILELNNNNATSGNDRLINKHVDSPLGSCENGSSSILTLICWVPSLLMTELQYASAFSFLSDFFFT